MEQDHIPRLSYRSMEVSYERSRGISGWAAALVEGGSPADTARETEPGDTADGLYAEKEQETKKAGMSEEDDF